MNIFKLKTSSIRCKRISFFAHSGYKLCNIFKIWWWRRSNYFRL